MLVGDFAGHPHIGGAGQLEVELGQRGFEDVALDVARRVIGNSLVPPLGSVGSCSFALDSFEANLAAAVNASRFKGASSQVY